MAQLIVRRLEDEVAERLRRRAKRHGRSMEDEVRDILRNASRDEGTAVRRLGSRISARFARLGLTQDLPELREQDARPAKFTK
jgi:plasmid stability protein